jgi:bacteriocin biosynthesis cyclodehydratase domain-containing protein
VKSRGVSVITLPDGRVVLKRGVREVLLSGESAVSTVERVVTLLDEDRPPAEIVAEFPGPSRPNVEILLGLLTASGEDGDGAEEGRRRGFYANFGVSADEVEARIAAATAVVVGVNAISRSLARSLLEEGLGRVVLVEHPVLDDEIASRDWVGDLVPSDGRFEVGRNAAAAIAGDGAILCATCDVGEAEALLELSRLALDANVVFLPAWIADMVGTVGPLTYPYETACMRCYRLRADANDPGYDVALHVRAHVTTDADARLAVGVPTPMAAVVGEIAAMEVLKAVGQFAPADTVARLIEINLVSFASTVRRVLKLPRCPDCSDTMRRAGVTLGVGAQIPYRESHDP